MNYLRIAILISLASFAAAQQPAVPAVPARSAVPATPATASRDSGREGELYDDLMDEMNDENWQQALEKSNKVIEMHGRLADAGLYWKAYALSKLNRRTEALNTIAELRKAYPTSKWLKDADALGAEIRPASGQAVSAGETEETKLIALNSLMNSDPEKAFPVLEQVLKSNNSPRIKDRAMFILAQSESPRAQQIVLATAKGQGDPALQRKAIQYLGLNDSAATRAALVDIYNTTQNEDSKRAVLHAFMTSDATNETLAVAQHERDPELRRDAIHQLGAMDARQQLYQLYQSTQNAEDREAILQAFGVAGDTEHLGQIARTAGPTEARVTAIRSLGIAGTPQSRKLLLEIYNSDKEHAIREAAVEGLFVDDDAHDLVAIARRETDPAMRKVVIEKLSVMDEKEAHDYMIELLNK